jgi:hypothetical protein
MQIEPQYPLDLSIIPDPEPGGKPDQPIKNLLELAIFGSPEHRLTVKELYEAMAMRFEWYRLNHSEVRAGLFGHLFCDLNQLPFARKVSDTLYR